MAASIRGISAAFACALAGCGAAPGAAPAPGAPPQAAALSSAEAGYGGCADPIRLSPSPPAEPAAALALIPAFVAQLRGPQGEPVRARRIGAGACEGLDDPALARLDFWLVGGRTVVFAPFAAGAPSAPAGFSLVAS